jgi:hypothetical protein
MRPHKFEVGLHLNLRKMLGDLPEDAPDQLLRLQQPAGPVPAGAAAGAGAAGRHATAQAAAPALEAHGLVLIGDLGLEELDEEGTWIRPPGLGFADLGGLLTAPGVGSRPCASSAAAAAAAGGVFEEGSTDEDSGSEGGAREGGGRAGGAGGSRGWASGVRGRGAWGRWGR